MKIQQIVYCRIGDQGWGDGYQVAAKSEGITPDIENQFRGRYTNISLAKEKADHMPPVCDWGIISRGESYVLTSFIRNTAGRNSIYAHGYVIPRETVEECLKKPERFLRMVRKCCITYDGKRVTKPNTRLPELEIADMGADDEEVFSVDQIREKYQLTDEKFRNLVLHIYEAILSDDITNLTFGWDGAVQQYTEIILDMMYLVYVCTPAILWPRISFSNRHVEGGPQSTFSVNLINIKKKNGALACSINGVMNTEVQNSWFDLKQGIGSSLIMFEQTGMLYKQEFIEYLTEYCGTEKMQKLLEWISEFSLRAVKRPQIKDGKTLLNLAMGAFLIYAPEYRTKENLRPVINSLCILKADDRAFLDKEIAGLLIAAVKANVHFTSVQLDNLEKLYTKTDSPGKRAYQFLIAECDEKTAEALLENLLLRESSEKNDALIELLLARLPKKNVYGNPALRKKLDKVLELRSRKSTGIKFLDIFRKRQ